MCSLLRAIKVGLAADPASREDWVRVMNFVAGNIASDVAHPCCKLFALIRRELSNLQGLKELSTGDTLVSPDSLRAAEFAAGGVLNAVDAVRDGRQATLRTTQAPSCGDIAAHIDGVVHAHEF